MTRGELLEAANREALAGRIATLAPGIPVGWVHFEVREPGGTVITFNSSHVGELPV